MGSRLIRSLSIALALACVAACSQKSPESSLESAKVHLAKGDLRAATIEIKNSLQIKPDLAEGRYLLGVVLLADGNAIAAAQEFRKALGQKFSADLVYPKLAEALLAQGDFKGLTKELSGAAVSSPESVARLQTALSKAYAGLNDAQSSEIALAAALAADPKFLPARVLQARKKASARDYDGSLGVIDEALLQSPADPELLTLKADVLQYGKHDTPGAADVYRKAVKAKPDYLPAHMAFIEAMLVNNDVAGASTQVAAMKKAVPNAVQTIYEEARLGYLKKDNKLGLERAQALLKRRGDNAAALQLAGAIELQANELTNAQAHLSHAIQIAPESLSARQYLVTTYLRMGNPEKALSTMQLMRGASGELPPSVFSLAGEVYLRNGDAERAETYFRKASSLDAHDAGKRTTLALARMILGQVEPAFSELEAIASTDKDFSADMALISARLQRREFDKALVAIDVLERKRSAEPIAAQLRGQTQLMLKNGGAARKSFERALQISPGYLPAITGLASLDLAEKKPEEARKRFASVVAKDPSNVPALLALAQLKMLAPGDHREAAELINRAIVADRLDVAARRALIDLYLKDKEWKQAAAAAADAVAVIPDNLQLLDALARAQRSSGDLNQSLATYGKLQSMQPGSAIPLLQAADVQMALKDAAGAEQSLRKALEIAPDTLDAQLRLVSLQVGSRRYADALATARLVQKQRPREPSGYLWEGDIALARGDKEAALTAYRQGLAKLSSPALAIKVHAVLLAMARAADADQFAYGWLKEHPRDAVFLFHLGDIALSQQAYPLAIERYLSVVRIEPRNAAAYNNLAWAAGETGKPTTAIDYARKAVAIDPGRAEYLDTLAAVLAGEYAYPEAVEWQKKALSAQPDNPRWRLNLAKIYKKSGNTKQAREELQALAKLGSSFSSQPEVAALLSEL